jgi:uncharacterized membrane protein SpoIIM required for sporulation
MIAAKIVDGIQLLKVVGYALAAGIGVTIAYSLAVFGITRVAEARRDARYAEATALAVVAAVGLAVSAGAAVLGIVVMATK